MKSRWERLEARRRARMQYYHAKIHHERSHQPPATDDDTAHSDWLQLESSHGAEWLDILRSWPAISWNTPDAFQQICQAFGNNFINA